MKTWYVKYIEPIGEIREEKISADKIESCGGSISFRSFGDELVAVVSNVLIVREAQV